MLFEACNSRYKKAFKGRNKGVARSRYDLRLPNSCGLKALSRARVTAKQLQSAYSAVAKRLKKHNVILRSNVYPDLPVSNKPTDVRMGKGKGSVAYYALRVRPGLILFEVHNVHNVALVKEILEMSAKKLPLSCKVVAKDTILN